MNWRVIAVAAVVVLVAVLVVFLANPGDDATIDGRERDAANGRDGQPTHVPDDAIAHGGDDSRAGTDGRDGGGASDATGDDGDNDDDDGDTDASDLSDDEPTTHLRVRVLDVDGAPIAGAGVKVWWTDDEDPATDALPDYEQLAVRSSWGRTPDCANAVTDEQGVALVPLPDPDQVHHLIATADGHRAECRRNLRPVADATTDVEVQLAALATISGRIVDQDHHGVPLARIVIAPEAVSRSLEESIGVSFHTLMRERNPWRRDATADMDGHFTLPVIPADHLQASLRLYLLVEARGYRRHLARIKPEALADGRGLQVTVERLACVLVDLQLPDFTSVPPGEDVDIRACPTSAIVHPTHPADASAHEAADGTSIGGLSWLWFDGTRPLAPDGSRDFHYVRPGTGEPLRLARRWDDSVKPTSGGGMFGDMVLSSNVAPGRPAPHPSDPPTDGARRLYRLIGLPAGDYTLTATAPGFPAKEIPLANVTSGELRGPVVIRLGTPATINGRVTDSRSLPIAGARVVVHRPDADYPQYPQAWLQKTTTGDDGTFTLDALPPGDVRVVVVAEGYRPDGQDVSLDVGVRRSVRVTLRRWQQIQGRVVDERGDAVPEFTLRAWRPRDRDRVPDHEWLDWEDSTVQVTVDEDGGDGRFTISGVGPGPWILDVSARGYNSVWAEATAGDGNIKVQLLMLGGITGTLTRADGSPPDSGYLAIQRLSDGKSFAKSLEPPRGGGIGIGGGPSTAPPRIPDPSLHYNSDTGGYGIWRLAPGRYVVRVYRDRTNAIAETTIDVPRGDPVTVNFDDLSE